jgi:hypothetical protein
MRVIIGGALLHTTNVFCCIFPCFLFQRLFAMCAILTLSLIRDFQIKHSHTRLPQERG